MYFARSTTPDAASDTVSSSYGHSRECLPHLLLPREISLCIRSSRSRCASTSGLYSKQARAQQVSSTAGSSRSAWPGLSRQTGCRHDVCHVTRAGRQSGDGHQTYSEDGDVAAAARALHELEASEPAPLDTNGRRGAKVILLSEMPGRANAGGAAMWRRAASRVRLGWASVPRCAAAVQNPFTDVQAGIVPQRLLQHIRIVLAKDPSTVNVALCDSVAKPTTSKNRAAGLRELPFCHVPQPQ